jgi:hypothetical protein
MDEVRGRAANAPPLVRPEHAKESKPWTSTSHDQVSRPALPSWSSMSSSVCSDRCQQPIVSITCGPVLGRSPARTCPGRTHGGSPMGGVGLAGRNSRASSLNWASRTTSTVSGPCAVP